MPAARYKVIVDKAIDACLAAIEIYNKPGFRYREESFSILMLNAWELLLKARVIQQNNGDIRTIEVWEPLVKKDGSKSKRRRKKLNRSGNTMTIGIRRAIELTRQYKTNGIDNCCKQNLLLLEEIRDNSIHFSNIPAGLGRKIQEVGCASLKNFVSAAEQWFGWDLSRYNFYLMPLSFHSPSDIVESLSNKNQAASVRRLMNQIATLEHDNPTDENSVFSVTMQIQMKFVKSSSSDAFTVIIDKNDPTAVRVVLSEDDILRKYPWDYSQLSNSLKNRYKDFSMNRRYHQIRKVFEKDESLCHIRYLDPQRQNKASRKRFYSPNILTGFDNYYTKSDK